MAQAIEFKTETHNLRGMIGMYSFGTEAYRFGGFYARLGLERSDGLFAGRVLGLAQQSKQNKTKQKSVHDGEWRRRR
jgi:hypothetical protein